MRKTFSGYYRPSEKEFIKLWTDCVFVLDTNVLLNFYRYSHDTANELFKILNKIKNRIWLPHQIALEYQRRRLDVIYQQKQSYEEALDFTKEASKEIKNKLLSSRHPFIVDADEITNKLDDLFNEIEGKLKISQKQCLSISEEDSIRKKITKLFEGKVGEPYEAKELSKKHKLGKERYENNIPPGYKDNPKYGDLIFWLQILDFAKDNQKSIVLVTDEKKEDWWYKFKGKIIGPRPELVDEIKAYANVEFYMYRVDPFMEHVKKHLKQKVKSEAIKEVKEIRKRDDGMLALTKAFSEMKKQDALFKNMYSDESFKLLKDKFTANESDLSKAFSDMKNIGALSDNMNPSEQFKSLKDKFATNEFALSSTLFKMAKQQGLLEEKYPEYFKSLKNKAKSNTVSSQIETSF